MKITRKQLEKLDFYQEGTEIGDDGGMEYKTSRYTIIWVPKRGRYDHIPGWYIENNENNDEIHIPIGSISELKQLKLILEIINL